MMNKKIAQKDFRRPPKQFRLVPFWFLNDRLKPAEMRRQVREFAKKNVGGAFMHGRFGLRTPYFSKDWWKCISAAIHEGKKINFNLWLYDDMNWASGWAHGKIYEENPGFQEQHLNLIEKDTTGPLHLVEWLPEGFPQYVYICRPDYSGLKEVTKDIWDWQLVTDIPAGPHKILFFMRRNSGLTHPITRPAHIDRLNPDATRAFIRFSHAEYKKRFGGQFGKTIPGIFTDEPGFYHNLWNKNPASLTWTKELPEFFKKRHGYELKDHLVCLWKETGNYRKVRCDFYDTVAEMFCTNYFKPISNWCRENSLKFTGHLEWEEGFQNHIQFSGHLMRPLRYFDIPGLDKIDRNKRRLTEKFVSSVAHLSGKERTLSETYACSGWDLTLEEMKAVCDWQYVRGVNFLNPHAFYYSIRAERKFECPPSEGHKNIFWPSFGGFADYVARLSYVLTRGRHRAPVALYYPIHSAWSLRRPDLKKNAELDKLSSLFDSVGHGLMENQVDFDILDDDFLLEADIGKGKIRVAGEEFSALVLAGVSVLPHRTYAILKEFVRQGGHVLVIPPVPEWIVNADSPGKQNPVIDLPGNRENTCRGSWKIFKGVTELAGFIKKTGCRDVILKTACPGLKYLCRHDAGWTLYFLVNESENPLDRRIELRGKGNACLLDAESGRILEMEGASDKDGWLSLNLKFTGFESKLVLISEKNISVDGVFHDKVFEKIMELKTGWAISIGQKTIKIRGGLKCWKTLGYKYYSGKAKYIREFSLDSLNTDDIWIDLGKVKEIAEVSVNGRKCGLRRWRPFLFEITDAIRPGKNRIEIEVTNTPKNEFEEFARTSGLLGAVVVYKNCRKV
ncbi:MAG: hypothetical protein KJ964_04590 [Verrucomicrobia bacterium]|nr:hypothetical protein [Verrucomicrobiota bacterium]MBU1733688.1 hypothetical protein [Verrucomicrobiota bacterium]